MNDKKICFIVCTNDEAYERECTRFISGLMVPDGFELEYLSIKEAKSMTSGYNEGMRASDAKYKIYLHQDTFLVDPEILGRLLETFSDPAVGMIGAVGSPRLPENAIMWDGNRIGRWYECDIALAGEFGTSAYEKPWQSVQAIDGFFMATQYDLPWREDLFDGWDYYDVSQSQEFIREGYRVVVPNYGRAWALHDCGQPDLKNYFKYQKRFLQEYEKNAKESAAASDK